MSLVLGQSPIFKAILEKAETYAPHDWPILILGETGVGKEVLAQHLHKNSLRAKGPMIPVNCSAIPNALIESELFGYERGAFSGALQSHKGLIRAAHNGTLFLDEIGELEAGNQAKLLRFLEEGEVRSIGSVKIDKVNVRIIAATNVNLYEAIERDWFRQDLLERLSVLTLEIPPLRARKEDIIPLARSFLIQMKLSPPIEELSFLERYEWPGNIRQLKNFIIKCVVHGNKKWNRSRCLDLMDQEKSRYRTTLKASEGYEQMPLNQLEKRTIVEKLRLYQGNRKETARSLGIAKSTLHEKIRKWKRSDPDCYIPEPFGK